MLREEGLRPKDIKRCVYVLRINGIMAVSYPKGVSPVVYIGEGALNARLQQHKKWLKGLLPLVEHYQFELGIAVPRVNGASSAYKDLEAVLLEGFARLYGSAPLRNKQFERRRYQHTYFKKDINEALKLGKGMRFHWAVEPMRASGYRAAYVQTHV